MLYEYRCKKCKLTFDALSTIDRRDDPRTCEHEACGGDAERAEIPASTPEAQTSRYEMAAVTRRGEIVPGRFGK